ICVIDDNQSRKCDKNIGTGKDTEQVMREGIGSERRVVIGAIDIDVDPGCSTDMNLDMDPCSMAMMAVLAI
ncbi:hypothetical protein STEG23_001117, partial [Scotinomys teguina]